MEKKKWCLCFLRLPVSASSLQFLLAVTSVLLIPEGQNAKAVIAEGVKKHYTAAMKVF